jgi:hypothetical protein
MDIKRKNMWYSNLGGENVYFSTYPLPTLTHLSRRFTSASKPAAWKSLDFCISHFRIYVSTSSSSAKHLPSSCEEFYAINTSNRKQEIFLYEYPLQWVLLPTETHNRTLLLDSTLRKHCRHFDYWNQPLNMCMRVCYLDCHEAGLCCYLVIHI